MPKKKERSELEYLKSQNRELLKENKKLKKTISRSTKKEHILKDLEDRLEEEYFQEDHTRDAEPAPVAGCPKCGRKLENVDLIKRIIVTCENCDYREVVKK